MGSGIDKRFLQHTIYHVLLGEQSIANVRISETKGRYHLIPANQDLAGAEIEMVGLEQRETRLKNALQQVIADYDLVLMDCPPALNLLTLNGLCAAHAVMIPMQCEYYALEGLSYLCGTIDKVRGLWNPRLQLTGILLTMVDGRQNLMQQVEGEVRQHFGDKVYRTLIPRNVRLSEAPSEAPEDPRAQQDPATGKSCDRLQRHDRSDKTSCARAHNLDLHKTELPQCTKGKNPADDTRGAQ